MYLDLWLSIYRLDDFCLFTAVACSTCGRAIPGNFLLQLASGPAVIAITLLAGARAYRPCRAIFPGCVDSSGAAGFPSSAAGCSGAASCLRSCRHGEYISGAYLTDDYRSRVLPLSNDSLCVSWTVPYLADAYG